MITRALDMGIDAGEVARAKRLEIYRTKTHPLFDFDGSAGETPELIEGWDMVCTAIRTRCYARGGLVTMAATMVVNDWEVRRGLDQVPSEVVVTFFGRGRTLSEAVEDLGRVGVF